MVERFVRSDEVVRSIPQLLLDFRQRAQQYNKRSSLRHTSNSRARTVKIAIEHYPQPRRSRQPRVISDETKIPRLPNPIVGSESIRTPTDGIGLATRAPGKRSNRNPLPYP